MGIRQEHDKVLKLQVLQGLYGMIPYHERAQHEASFEAAYRFVLGETWDESGLSLESADGLGHYLRGIHSVKGTPVRLNQHKLMRGLARSVLSLESRLEDLQGSSLTAALLETSLEADTSKMFSRYGLIGLSLEADDKPSAWKNLGRMISGLFKGKEQAKEEPFDYRKVDWQSVHKMADYIKNDVKLIHHMQQAPVEGKISGDGIVHELAWGNVFDEKDPVGFLKKKFADWEKFYSAHEAAIDKLSKAVMSDQTSTRKAAMAVRDDVDAVDKVLGDAVRKFEAMESPAKVGERMKPTFPGGRAMVYATPGKHNVYGSMDILPVKNFTGPKEIRPLKTEEAQQLVAWLREHVENMKKWTTIFDKARWSDHSDGDEFWDVTEQSAYEYAYASHVYWQSINADLMDGVDDISIILSHLSRGIMNWVDRSFPNR